MIKEKLGGVQPITRGGTGATDAAGARTNLGITETQFAFRNYELNGCNIDSTNGNWTVGLSENGHGTYPPFNLWCQVTQFDCLHFKVQIGVHITNSNTANRNEILYYRSKWSGSAWSDWMTDEFYVATTAQLKARIDNDSFDFWDTTKNFIGRRINIRGRGYVEIYTKFDGNTGSGQVFVRKKLDGVYYGDW